MGPHDFTTVRATRPPITRRNDFFDFWSATLAELDRTPPNPRLGVSVTSPEGARIVPVRFASLGSADIQGFLITLDDTDGERVEADASVARTAAASPRPSTAERTGEQRRRPLVVTTHGYNSQCNPVLEARHTVACDADLFCFDVRGFGLSRTACPVDPDGYVLTGLTDPRQSILRGAVCDYVRAAEVGRLLGSGEEGLVFHGRSFGGSLALVAQAITQAADYLAAAVPTFGWADGRRRLVKVGSGGEINDYLARHPAREEAVMRTLSYFDTVNVADRIGCPALIGVGRRDTIVPAPTVYAIANHMEPAPEIIELPVSHSEDPEERHWMRFDRRWTAVVAALAAQYSS